MLQEHLGAIEEQDEADPISKTRVSREEVLSDEEELRNCKSCQGRRSKGYVVIVKLLDLCDRHVHFQHEISHEQEDDHKSKKGDAGLTVSVHHEAALTIVLKRQSIAENGSENVHNPGLHDVEILMMAHVLHGLVANVNQPDPEEVGQNLEFANHVSDAHVEPQFKCDLAQNNGEESFLGAPGRGLEGQDDHVENEDVLQGKDEF
mmetsp:Transcript_64985/g.141652  ORF Transcript_64985/g.141652 Transcript_64985/m.141652 type:complete len:205 (+) Transcript_64985:292-906(+)